MSLVPYVKSGDEAGLRRAIQGLNRKLGINSSPTFANATITGLLTVPQITGVDTIQFDTNYSNGFEEGRLQWNSDDGNLEVGMPGGVVNNQIGKELIIRVRNKDVTDLAVGEVVYAYPTAVGGKNVQRSTASDATIASQTVGVVMEPITVNQFGYIALIGVVSGFDTSGFTYGQIAYLGTTPGTIVTTRPEAPNAAIEVGIVVYPHHTEGVIYARIAAHPTLSGIGDVHIDSVAGGDFPQWVAANSRWENSSLFDSMGEPTGFDINDTDTMGDISFVDGTRTFSIAPKAGESDFRFWDKGIEYVKTSQEDLIITDVEGVHVLYYDGATLTDAVNPSGYLMSTLVRQVPLVSIMYWNATDKELIYFGEERHGMQMDGSTHSYLHYTVGLAYLSGLGLNTLDVDQNGSLDAHAQFGVDAGGLNDEDIYISPSAVTSTTGLPIYYMLGAGPRWVRDINAGFSVRTYDGTTATRLAYNEYTGGAWQLTEESGGDFVLYHVFATTEIDSPMICIMGQNGYNNKSSARAGAAVEIRELILNDVMFPEIRPIATVIYQTKTTYANAVNARIVSTDEGEDYVDWRDEIISRVAVSTSDHGALSGLNDDDHGDYHNDARAVTWLAANHETTYTHADIALNTTHRGSDGSDHSKVTANETAIGLNTTHRTSNGSDHGYINQDVQSSASPTFVTTTLTGLLNLPTTTSTVGQVRINSNRVLHTYRDNTFVGTDSGNFTMTSAALNNTAVGCNSLSASTTGSGNAVLGADAMQANTEGFNSVAVGQAALYTNTTGHSNLAVGWKSLYANTTGTTNLAVGASALRANTEGINNLAIGSAALRYNIDGNANTAFGTNALNANTTGDSNLAIGALALYANTTGWSNIAIGGSAGRYYIGSNPALNMNNGIYIGTSSIASSSNAVYEVVIGGGAVGAGSNTFRLGRTANTLVQMSGGLAIQEQAAAAADTAGYGQLWIKNTTPCELWFTDDAGTDTQIV